MRANEHFHTSEELRVNRELRLVWKFLVKPNKEKKHVLIIQKTLMTLICVLIVPSDVTKITL